MLGNIEKRGVHGELENKEYSRLESLLEKHKFYKSIFTNNCSAIFVIIDRIFMEQYFYLKEHFVMD